MTNPKAIERRAFTGSIANAVLFAFTFIQSVLLVPIFLNTWGKEKYGIWLTLSAFFTLVKTLDLGHQNFVGNEINQYYNSNLPKAREILGSSLRIAYFLGAFELIAGGIMLYWFGDFMLGTEENLSRSPGFFTGAVSMLLIWFITGSASGILARILITVGLFTRFTYWGIIMKLLEIVLLLIASVYRWSVPLTCGVMAACTLIYSLVVAIDIKKHTPQLYPWWKFGSIRTGAANLWKSQILTATGFIEQFGTNIQLFAVSSTFGSGAIPGFTTMKTLTNIAIQVVNVFTAPLGIDIVRMYIEKDAVKLQELFQVIWLTSLVFVYVPFVLLTPFAGPLYDFWTHGQLEFNQPLYYLLVLSVSAFTLGTPFRLMLFGVNHLRSLLAIALIRIGFLALIPAGVNKFGFLMIGGALLASEIAASLILPYFFVRKETQKMGNPIRFKNLLLPGLPVMLMAVNLLILSVFKTPVIVGLATAITFILYILCGVWLWRSLSDQTRLKISTLFSKFSKMKMKGASAL